MPELYCVRADAGKYAKDFLKGGYVAYGALREIDLSNIKDRQQIQELWIKAHPDITNPYVTGIYVGQIARFILEMKSGDYVITMSEDSEIIYWGIVKDEPYYYEKNPGNCPYTHIRKVEWNDTPVHRSQFSVPFQNSIRSSLSVYSIGHKDNFFVVIGKTDFVKDPTIRESSHEIVIKRILELDSTEFEILVTRLLTALGFESQHTGRIGDEGVDATGELDLYGLAKIKLYVQAKRYKRGTKISANTVKELRQNIPSGAQGAFITTADFNKHALEIGVEQGFPRIGTINGEQLVDLLAEKWDELDLPEEIRQKLSLKRGLVVE